ncbi:alpha/beta fold hydrolase [Comamonas composti]|uniref:alpha/beta fold hydrolase n=1 Tax=Comamonas composti TaxID=408558 RepID=UPI0004065A15|nr:alpha/beta hydrolase [Comamonas composti]
MIEYLQHGRIRLALHQLKTFAEKALPAAHPLLMLHGLGESSGTHAEATFSGWPGPVYALDFTGHGVSTIPRGGGYSSEALMADADIALAHLGQATLCARGLGAYVGVLLAGARPEQVLGTILLDGPGLAGACPMSTPYIPAVQPQSASAPDSFALAELATEHRPPPYALHFARLAAEHSPLDEPIAICLREDPAWLREVRERLQLSSITLDAAFERFSRPKAV